MGGFGKEGKRNNLSVDVKIMGRRDRGNFEFLLVFLVILVIGRGHKTGSVVDKIGRVEMIFLFLDFLPNREEIGMMLREVFEDSGFVFESKTSGKILKRVKVAADEINRTLIERFFGVSDNLTR